ncbi:unnamed protein product [Bursaphelenchus xylophilus]|uniref:(pine wood nematode) hypothetical protein n=1 Tax=Bursaphelenchus xylophilus TaxID=6326 RepID=A0A1I7S5Y4_BURXY|nr:unnamed protein product [Bursaphelenchus xylophilus]CAG9082516.1 unnamed protein product [Bursaphelenchus xylophilus]
MYRTVVVALLALSASARLHDLEKKVTINDLELFNGFQKFAETYNKQYASVEEARERFEIYKANHLQLQVYQQYEQGTATYGETQFMDLTPEEFRTQVLSNVQKDPLAPHRPLNDEELKALKDDAPAEFDHREAGLVTHVKKQGDCGSCWAFAATGNIEGLWKKKTGELFSLSEQQLVDCDKKDKGCQGGYMLPAFEEIIRLGGLVKEEEYPYKGLDGECQLENKKIAAYINDSLQLPEDEEKIKQYLVSSGPIAVGINAIPLQFYHRGIHHPLKFFCDPQGLNHGVLLVGYGEERGKPFWIVKNSWGDRWGEKGYFRLFRGQNVCGVAGYATTAIIN